MSKIQTFIKKHPLPIYFILTFVISWGSVLLVIGGPGKILVTREQIETLLPIVILTMLTGPTVAGLLLTGLIDGRAGFRELRSRLFRWRVGARWYAVALLTAPLIATMILLILLPSSPVFLPGIFASGDKITFLLLGITSGLVVGFFEEIGWTGFATPRLRLRYGVLATGLILGFLWGAWHSFLAFCGNSTSSGALSLALFLPEFLYYVTVLPAYRVLMVLIYDRTGSLLVAVLMHASLTASVPFILMPLEISGASLMTEVPLVSRCAEYRHCYDAGIAKSTSTNATNLAQLEKICTGHKFWAGQLLLPMPLHKEIMYWQRQAGSPACNWLHPQCTDFQTSQDSFISH